MTRVRQVLKLRWPVQLAVALAGLLAIGTIVFSLSSAQSYELSFGYDRGIQFVDPDGLNQVPFWLLRSEATVDFKLYELAPAQFIEQYRNYSPWESQNIDVTGLPVVTAWQQSFTGSDTWTMRPVTLSTGTVPSGIYVIEASHPDAGLARALIAVGRNSLLLKRGSGGQIVAWASRLQTGAPVSGMTVTVYDANASSLAQGVTDADGIATLSVSSGDALMAISQAGDEITLAGLDWQWQNYSGYSYSANPNAYAYAIYLHTERPIYRPGDTVYYNAIVRNNLPSGYSVISSSQPVSVTLRDSRANVVATQIKTADEFGALAGEFLLGTEPPLGDYTIELSTGGQVQTQRLRVEEYRKPEYEVKITTPASFAISGDSIPVTVAADYFFGQPVSNAAVKLQIYRQPYYWYNYWWWYGHSAPPSLNGLVVELNGITDGTGRWSTTFTPDAIDQYNAFYTFKATVTDARNQPVVAESEVTVYWNTFKLAVATDHYGYRSDEVVAVQLSARGHDEAPVTGQAATIRIVRDEWQTGGSTDAVPPQTVTTDGQGQAIVTFASLPRGWYRIIASSVDSRGRSIEAYSYLWVYDDGGDSWWYWNNDEISITADKESYAPGDTATLLIQSRVQGVALLTVERAGIHKEIVVPINGAMATVQLPITADFAPNVYAKVHIFKRAGSSIDQQNAEGQIIAAKTELLVPAADKRLEIEITPNATVYRPGEQATLTLRVTDANGQPVRARVSLALVDEAIFALQEDLAANLFDSFYGRRPNSVLTYDSLVRHPYNYLFAESPPTADMSPTGTPAPTPAPQLGQTATTAPRRIFLDTAYWNPAIITGEDGVATVTVALPDNLTTWRIIARAVTVDTKVGETKSKLLVTQEIIARPALPRFAVLGDRFTVGIIAQNFSGGDTGGAAEIKSEHVIVLNPGAQSINLPNRGTAVANWTAVAAQIGTGPVTSTVSTSAGQDLVELPLDTKPFAAPERWSASGQADPVATASFTVPFNAVNEASELTVRLSSSIALGLLDGLDELIDYPYGCVEQTMSRVLPSAVAAKAYADLGIPNPKADELPDIISQGVQKLYGFQHQDGSWGWFYDDDGGAYMTAYVLFGLTTIEQAGFEVDSGALNRGFNYLDSVLSTAGEPATKAFALYVKASAGRGNLPMAQSLVGQSDGMDAAALSALALALQLDGDGGSAQTVIDKLLVRVHETPTWASWPLNNADWEWYHWQTMSSTEKNTAFALRALLALRGNHPLLPKIARWLMDHRNGAGWGGYGSANTQATAFAVLGLSEYIQIAGELEANYAYTVQLNGQTIANGQVTPVTARQPIPPIHVPGAALHTGENELLIQRESGGSGQLYYTAMLNQQLFYDGFEPVTSVDQGLALQRSYKLVEGTARPDGAYNIGDLVEVTLEVEASARMSYVLMQDPIPAGFEALSERVNPISWSPCEFCFFPEVFFWRDWGYNRKDVRDDRVDFFITELWPGKHTYTYLMRATVAGEFSVLPGQAYPMYNEAIWGRSASQQVRVAPESLAARPTLAGDFNHDCRVTLFDTRQVAGVYGTTNANRNVVNDATITLSDVAAVTARTGATCLSDRAMPGQGSGAARFDLSSAPSQIGVGEQFAIEVTLGSATTIDPNNLDGFALTLHFDPHKMGVVQVRWNSALGNVVPLGPTIDETQGTVALGAIELPTGLHLHGPLATITFKGRGVGSTQIAVTNAEAMNSAGQIINASAQGSNTIVVDGEQLFLPMVNQ